MKNISIPVYKFDELDCSAQNQAISKFLQGESEIRNDVFYEDIKSQLKMDFPSSDLDIQYSLGCCQGDGLNIYGKVSVDDVLNAEKFAIKYTCKEKRRLRFYAEYWDSIRLSYNTDYSYSCKFIDAKNYKDDAYAWIAKLKSYDLSNIDEDLIDKFTLEVFEYFEELDEKYEAAGYKYIYPDEEYCVDYFRNNACYFSEDGTVLYEEVA